ncbi:MAG: twin-arginine translocation signal domain-containing protein [Syntrophaceae bacterium]|nr:twin-arginine translocation signal domain-containing protein [Syntrophaceae bacterium]
MQRRDFLKAALGTAAVGFVPATSPAKLIFEQKTFSSEYQKYLDELNKNWEKWERVFRHGKIAGINHIKEIAMLSENLRKWNEKSNNLSTQWKRLSLPICWRSQIDSVSRELFGYQVMTQPTQLVFCSSVDENWKGHDQPDKTGWDICGYTLRRGSYRHNGVGHFSIYGKPIAAKTRKMKCCMWSPEVVLDLRCAHHLDAEAELAAILSMELALEQDREHIINVNKNCSTFYNEEDFQNGGRLSPFLEWAITEERKKFLDRSVSDHEKFEWIVTSPEIVAKLEKENALTPTPHVPYCLGVHLVGWLRNSSARVRVYQDPILPSKEILIGRKYSDIDTGYIVIPYLCYLLTPIILDPSAFCTRQEFLVRYSQMLTNSNFYAKMIVNS